MTTILVIDDHPIVLEGCRRLIEDQRLGRVLQARGPAEGFRLYRRARPDLMVLDLSMQKNPFSGLSFLRRLRLHDTRIPVLVFSMHNDPAIAAQAIHAGASGYLLKDCLADELVTALQTVRSGRPYLSPGLAADVAFLDARSGGANPLRELSLRELETLAFIAEGKPYSVIAAELNVSYKTVANTVSHIKTKLGAGSLPELMRLAIQHLGTARGGKPRGRLPDRSRGGGSV